MMHMIEINGSGQDVGRQHGEALREPIAEHVALCPPRLSERFGPASSLTGCKPNRPHGSPPETQNAKEACRKVRPYPD